MAELFLGLGTNLGDKKNNLITAIHKIEEQVGVVVARSALFYSEPWGFQSLHSFINQVICVETSFSPYQILETTQQIERDMGRLDKSVGGVYHDRIIDIDLLAYDSLIISTPQLTLPHPGLYNRPFFSVPYRECLKIMGKSI
ncbi:2-amino-4-hydroxy-6-hydroxymethyldihydropteridine diphosphokinase [Coprobacter tertius]|uniref:2-amino-4-hydroxy-6-hydroxymethyldihydropteridine pyrophosphokinase n=1 Tax=Coprobacter tertius TaxID=2944915 RepID=A0ABT1MD20_9BACT|nr:2-amino-4-hydroxy-6-hydroxymethyldihydropteridine diphosphokinase [Coprobacter tertius]MCP9610515.1 2-amino-4-hydroxy-6-hydroxymethyldihydropteridine diphosphokinase [Coprobacter tertius]